MINKIRKKYSLLELAGILSEEEAKEIKSYLNEMQKRLRKEIDNKAEKLK